MILKKSLKAKSQTSIRRKTFNSWHLRMNQEHGSSQGGSVLWNGASKGSAPLYSPQGWENLEHRVVVR